MMKIFKNNSRTKLISLLSAIVLWLYVMTVVDPVESRTYKDIPINITNTKEITENGLVIYPKETIKTNLYVKGKLSNLKRIDSDNIRIYGVIEQPREGKNIISLRAHLSENVSYEINPSVVTINLEKNITQSKKIKVNLYGKEKNNIDTMKLDSQNMNITGPRELIDNVQNLVAELDMTNKESDFSTTLKLVPKDKNGIEVRGVKLDKYYVKADISLLKEKIVPVNLLIDNPDKDINSKSYKLRQSQVTIKGKSDLIFSINSIDTKPIDLSEIDKDSVLNVELNIPTDIKSNLKTVDVEITVDDETKEYKIPKNNVKYINNDSQIDVSKIDLPEYIKVSVTTDKSNEIQENSIELFIDLSDKSNDGHYKIYYKTSTKVKNVNIVPNNVKI